ncbi:MAG: Trk system potassium transporter TrkA [Spirochaetes bacterium]|nr:Trk system potassium transporter TrkA [Spirochaetota bacterium]
MNIVILGAGVVGYQIASQLISEGHNVAIIEKNSERARYIDAHLDCIVLNDEGNSFLTLKKAGIEKADCFLSVVDSDEVNMIACGIVESEFNVPIKIARVRNIDYSRAKIFEKSFLGIDFVVNPEVETARQIANSVALGAMSDVMLFEKSDVEIRNYQVNSKSFFKNKNLIEIRKTINPGGKFLITGIVRENNFIIPTGNTTILEDDIIYIIASRKTLTKLFIETGKKSVSIDKILIIGGGRIGFLVTKYLIRTGVKITIIDPNYETCRTLTEKYPDVLIINADISDETIFEEENLSAHDLIITTTDNQELNILNAAYGKNMGIGRAIAVVNHPNYMLISNKLGIDVTVSPRNSTVDAIIKYIRKGEIRSVHTLFGNSAEVIEFSIQDNSEIIGIPIKDIKIPPDSLILTVVRNKVNEIPDGNFVVLNGDRVITIVKRESIQALEKVFLN